MYIGCPVRRPPAAEVAPRLGRKEEVFAVCVLYIYIYIYVYMYIYIYIYRYRYR